MFDYNNTKTIKDIITDNLQNIGLQYIRSFFNTKELMYN